MTDDNTNDDKVRAYYTDAAHAAGVGQRACCGVNATAFGAGHYDTLDGIPDTAVLASIGCGNPAAVADIRAGDIVLDLGSGGGIDVLLSAQRVGPTGFVYGVDFTPAMLELAQRNASAAGATNVEFLEGHIDAVPLPDASIDVIISNCVVNLAADKSAVFSEMFRLLRPGGHLGITDVVTDDDIAPEDRARHATNIECVAGALPIGDYRHALAAAGFTRITITITHPVADKVHSAIIQAHRSEPCQADLATPRVLPRRSPDGPRRSLAAMITSIHALIYSDDPAATRAFLRDVLGWPYIDDASSEPGWLIFGTGRSELGVHPTHSVWEGTEHNSPRHHEISLMCDNIETTRTELTRKGATFSTPVADAGYGYTAMLDVPGADPIMLYQPKHATAFDL